MIHLGEALLERLHDVDDRGLAALLRHGDLLALNLLLDDFPQPRLILVLVVLRMELPHHRADKRFRHRQLRLADPRLRDLFGRFLDLVGKEQRLGKDAVVGGDQGEELLLGANNGFGDGDFALLLHSAAQQFVSLIAALLGDGVIGLVEVNRSYAADLRKVQDVDGLVLFGLGFLEVIVRHGDVFALFVLEALDDVLRADLLAAVGADLLVFDAAGFRQDLCAKLFAGSG